jgi:hypothetical protein
MVESNSTSTLALGPLPKVTEALICAVDAGRELGWRIEYVCCLAGLIQQAGDDANINALAQGIMEIGERMAGIAEKLETLVQTEVQHA